MFEKSSIFLIYKNSRARVHFVHVRAFFLLCAHFLCSVSGTAKKSGSVPINSNRLKDKNRSSPIFPPSLRGCADTSARLHLDPRTLGCG